MSAILFGSISTLTDTSELQREAFNQAFTEHGLDWRWDREDYRAMLDTAGGRDRVAEYARARGESVDADAVHATKSAKFRENLGFSGAQARPGVLDTIRAAKDQGLKIGLVTTTSADNVSAVIGALAPELRREDFDVVVDASRVETSKPDAAAYTFALREVGEEQSACVAVEDNVNGVQAAAAAGVACVAFPNQNTAGHEFPDAARRVDHLDLDELRALAAGA